MKEKVNRDPTLTDEDAWMIAGKIDISNILQRSKESNKGGTEVKVGERTNLAESGKKRIIGDE